MSIAGLASTEQTTAIESVFVANDVRALIANHLGISVSCVTDEAHFTTDLGADWLDRLDLMMAVEDRFAGVEITDNDVDRIELVVDLVRHVETWDTERRRRGAAPVFHNLFGPHVAHVSFFYGSRATRCVVLAVGAVRPDSRLIFSFMSTTPPLPACGPMWCIFNARTAERNMRLRCSGLPQNHSRPSFLKRSAQCISTPRDGTRSVTHEVLVRARHSETAETLRPQARVTIAVPFPLRCDCYATVCRDLGL